MNEPSPQAITIAAIQMNSQEAVDDNLVRVEKLVAEAAHAHANLVVLPENFAFMGPEEEKRKVAEVVGEGRISTFLKELAKKHDLAIVAGGMPERSADEARPFNTSLFIDERGELLATYRKIHLFDAAVPGQDALVESRGSSAGETPTTVNWNGVTLGLTICYDVRFPELYRILGEKGAKIVTVPAAFTMLTGKDHWHVLLRARAIENQCFIVAAAQNGRHGKSRLTYGKSLIVDPWGDVLAQAGEGEGMALARCSFERLEEVRKQLPALTHRKL